MATKLTTTRQERGEEIAKLSGQIKRIDSNTYEVLSQSGHGKYEVLKSSIDWMCQCPDHIYRGIKCKHIHAVLFSKSIRAEVAIRKISPINNLSECIYCHSTPKKQKRNTSKIPLSKLRKILYIQRWL